MFDKILYDAKRLEGNILNRLKSYIISFSRYIELSSVKLAQEWIKNVADPDISDAGTRKLSKDITAVINLFQSGIEDGELNADTPIEQVSYTINDLLYGQLLCWAISGGKYSFEERAKEFCDIYLNKIMEQYLI